VAELLIQYSTSKAFASAIIRRLTHSPFSHIDIKITDDVAKRFGIQPGLLGASGPDCTWQLGIKMRRRMGKSYDPGGVRVRSNQPWPYMFPPRVARLRCSDKVHDETLAFALLQRYKPFDKSALYGFLRDRAGLSVVKRDWRDPEQWFCAELIVRSCEAGGLFPYHLAITKDVVSPGDTLLIFNPFMTNLEDFEDVIEHRTEDKPLGDGK